MTNKILFHLTLLILSLSLAQAQNNVGIGTHTPNASASLDISSTTQGLWMPGITTAQRTAIPSPAKGLMVFHNNTKSCWNYDGNRWLNMASATNNLSTFTGNGGNYTTAHFIGTSDGADAVFKQSNRDAGRLADFNTSLGKGSLVSNAGIENTASGNEV